MRLSEKSCAPCADATWDNDEWESSAPAAPKASAPAARKPPAAAGKAARTGSLGAGRKKAEDPAADDDWGKW